MNNLHLSISIIILHLLFISRLIADQSYIDISNNSYIISGIILIIISTPLLYLNKFKLNVISKYLFSIIITYLIISIINLSLFTYTFPVLKELIRYFNLLLIVLFTYNLSTEKLLDNIFKFYFLLISSIAILQITGIIPATHHIDNSIRIDSLLGHPNALGNYLSIIGFYFIYRYYKALNKKQLLLFVVSLIMIFFTQSRTSIILFMFCLVLFFFTIYIKAYHINALKKILIISTFLIISGISFYLFKDRFLLEIYSIFDSKYTLTLAIKERNLTGSFTWRLFNWYMLVNHLFHGNYWFGEGLAVTPILNESITGAKLEAHNDYVKVLFETGLIGLITIFLINLKLLFKLRTISSKDISLKFIFIAFLSFTIFKFFDGLEQSNVFMYCLFSWSSIVIKKYNNENSSVHTI